MTRRLVAVTALCLLLLSALAPAASASHGFSVTIDQKATLTAERILVQVSGTYSCGQPDGGIEQNNSGFGFNVIQFHKNGVISGGAGIFGGDNPLTCNGTPQAFTFWIQGFDSSGQPALWHGGRAIVQGGGEVCNADRSDCAGLGFTAAIRISG